MRCSLSKNPSGGESSHGSWRFSDISTWKALVNWIGFWATGLLLELVGWTVGSNLISKISRRDDSLEEQESFKYERDIDIWLLP